MKKKIPTLLLQLLSLSFILLAADSAFGQSAPISYKGQFTESGSLASGSFDMQFKLFDTVAVGSGAQKGSTITQLTTSVTNGVFNANLDFGAAVFDGSPRFLEISVRRSGGSYSTLAPRQQVVSVPYAVHSLNATQLAGVPSSNFLKANTDGNVGIGAATPAAGVRLEVNGPTRVTAGGSGGFLEIGAPNGETGLGVIGDNRFDLRFDDDTLKLAAGPGNSPPPAQFGITINTNGNVGIGMPSPLPASQWKLEIDGPTQITSGQGAVQFSLPNGEMGMSYQSIFNGKGMFDGRADLRFDGDTLKLVAGLAGGPPSADNGLVITKAGNVGIGTTTPIAKLQAETPEAQKIAVYGHATSTSSVGVYGAATGVGGVGVYAEATGKGAAAVHAKGNATQAIEKGGFVKAMVYVDPFLPSDRYVVHCYNSHPGNNPATTEVPCGITVTREAPGRYSIYFGFDCTGCFISLTLGTRQQNVRGYAAADRLGVEVILKDYDDIFEGSDSEFYLIVY